jgi:hypothetical protein
MGGADVLEAPVSAGLRAPFPWFGGKSRVSSLVWSRLGDVQSYNEPFAGSLAVLLGRPTVPRVETVNDLDCYLANFWRSVQRDPDAVAYWADAPVNEADLHAWHLWLVATARERAERIKTDPDFFDPQIAGCWVWGQCLWIGSGWCRSPTVRQNVWKKRPAASRTGTSVGVHRQELARHANGASAERIAEWAVRPDLSTANGRGGLMASTRRWQGGGASGGGSGVHSPRLTRQIPALNGDAGATGHGIHASAFDLKTGGLYAYMHDLATRLRRVRVCCGDWARVLTPSVTTYIGVTGVFLDPPYSHDEREICYAEDHDISADVREWAVANGDNPNFRIALCGYEGEHQMPDSWECVPWKAHGGYSRTERGVANRSRERVWFSPHCGRPSDRLNFDEPDREVAS